MKAVSTQQAGSKAAGLRGSGGLAREAGKIGGRSLFRLGFFCFFFSSFVLFPSFSICEGQVGLRFFLSFIHLQLPLLTVVEIF